MTGVFIQVKGSFKRSVGQSGGGPTLFLSQTFTCINIPAISAGLLLLFKRRMKLEHSVTKRRHIKFRRRGIT